MTMYQNQSESESKFGSICIHVYNPHGFPSYQVTHISIVGRRPLHALGKATNRTRDFSICMIGV
jgi:hypothetical protein